jgi:hypothetical protein
MMALSNRLPVSTDEAGVVDAGRVEGADDVAVLGPASRQFSRGSGR